MSVIVQWGDSAGPFMPHANNRHVDLAYTKAVDRLLRVHASQPPSDLNSTDDAPALLLMSTDVAGQRRWCFCFRGRNGAGFSNAGGSWFVFPDNLGTASETWELGLDQFPQLRRVADRSDEAAVRDASAQVLHAILVGSGASVITLGATNPAATLIRALSGVLNVIPPALAEPFAFATFPISVPTSDLRLVTGEVPGSFAVTGLGRRLQSWQGSVPGPHAADEITERVIEWLADQAVNGSTCIAPTVREPSQFVKQIVEQHLPIEADDVSSYVLRAPTLLLGRGRNALRSWVVRRPADAIELSADRAVAADIRQAIFDDLIDEQVHSALGQNPAYFPPKRAPDPDWHMRLADGLKRRYPNHADLLDYLDRSVVGDDLPLADFDVRCQFDWWFKRLGVDHVAEYGAPAIEVADQVQLHGAIPLEWVKALRASLSGDAILADAARHLGVTPAEAAVLARAAVDSGQLMDVIALHNADVGQPIGRRWVDAFEKKQVPVEALKRLRVQTVLSSETLVDPKDIVTAIQSLTPGGRTSVEVSVAVLHQIADSLVPPASSAERPRPQKVPASRMRAHQYRQPVDEGRGARIAPPWHDNVSAGLPKHDASLDHGTEERGPTSEMTRIRDFTIQIAWPLLYFVFGFVLAVLVTWSFGRLG